MTILQSTNAAKTCRGHGTSKDPVHHAQHLHLLASFLVYMSEHIRDRWWLPQCETEGEYRMIGINCNDTVDMDER
jgi:hypothetical protein